MSIKVRYTPENIKPKNAVVYLRVSKEEQVDNFSLGTQEELCRKDAIRRGYNVIEVFREEGKSAKTIVGRPTLLTMLDYCRKNKKQLCAVFVYRLDRLSRKTQDYLTIRRKLAENAITVVSASEPTGSSPTETLMETIIASFAQHDNDVRSERTKNGMRARFLSGLSTGQAPIGYINENGYIVKNPQSFDKVKAAWELMLTGTKSLREVANVMNDWGLGITYKGIKHQFRQQTANRVFRNKFYMGILTSRQNPEEVQGQHTPMITSVQFYQVQAILDGRNTNLHVPIARHNKENAEFPLRRILHCSQCGAIFTGAWSKGRNNRYAYYLCRKRCGMKSIPVEKAQVTIVKTLRDISLTDNGLRLLVTFLRSNYMKRIAIFQKRKAEADVELTQLYARRQTLVEKNLAGIYSDEIFKEQNAIIENKIQDMHEVKNTSLLNKYNLEETANFITEKFADLGRTYETSSLEEKKALLGLIFPSGITWNPNGITNREISPFYQSILDFTKGVVHLGDPNRNQNLQLL
jgi:site-specific DNA recombinase